MASRGPRSGSWLCPMRSARKAAARPPRAVYGMETSGLHAIIDSDRRSPGLLAQCAYCRRRCES
eukprot:2310246-Prymnesium_polylepis.1